jgi:tellurite resistance protein TerA
MTLRAGEHVALPTAVVRLEFGQRAGRGRTPAEPAAVLLARSGVRLPPDAPAYAHTAVRIGVRREGGAEGAGAADIVSTLTVDLASLASGVAAVRVELRARGAAFDRSVRVLAADTFAGDFPAGDPLAGDFSEVARLDCAFGDGDGDAVVGECVRHGDGWRLRAGAFSGGGGVVAPSSAVTLTREAPSVSLALQEGSFGALRATPRWRAAPGGRTAARLDLCALFELSDGNKGVVQSLGGAFGALDRPPFLRLGGDPHTGEHLTANLDAGAAQVRTRGGHFRRVLLFVSAYGGERGFEGLRGSVTLRLEHGADIGFDLDACPDPATVCALALLTRDGPDLVVRREARFLVPRPGVSPQRTVDYAYGWGLNWTPGHGI